MLGQAIGGVRRFLAAHPFDFPLLVDPTRDTIKAFGVYQYLWFDAYNIARPSVFLIDRAGAIRKIFVGESQTDRPGQDAVLAAIDEIQATNGGA